MRKMIYERFSEALEVSESNCISLVIENKNLFRNIIHDFQDYDSTHGHFLFYKDGESIIPNITLVSNPLVVQLNDKSITTELNKELANLLEELPELYQNFIFELRKLGDSILFHELSYDLNYDLAVKPSQIIKLLNFHVRQERETDLDHLLNWIRIKANIGHIEMLVFLFLHEFFTTQEIDNIISTALSVNIIPIIIETQLEKMQFSAYEIVWIIDKDLCVISI